MVRLAEDEDQTKSWKAALRWVRDRASDHVVTMIDSEGSESSKKLIDEKTDPSQGRTYTDCEFVDMMNFFVFAKLQYASFL